MDTDGSNLLYAQKDFTDVHAIFTRNSRKQETVWVENQLVPKVAEFFRPKYSVADLDRSNRSMCSSQKSTMINFYHI